MWSQPFGPVTLEVLKTLEPTSREAAAAHEQFTAARDAAVAIVKSGSVGDPKAEFRGYLGASDDPEHPPTDSYGLSRYSVSVSVTRS